MQEKNINKLKTKLQLTHSNTRINPRGNFSTRNVPIDASWGGQMEDKGAHFNHQLTIHWIMTHKHTHTRLSHNHLVIRRFTHLISCVHFCGKILFPLTCVAGCKHSNRKPGPDCCLCRSSFALFPTPCGKTRFLYLFIYLWFAMETCRDWPP